MIITQTPLRISLVGGGTDFPAFFNGESGRVISTTIDKYIFVILKRRFDNKIRVGYSKTEMVDSIDQLQHELVREAMRKTNVLGGIEISTMADIPSTGTGLGSSSSLTVGLLNALHAYRGEYKTPEILASEACEIEIDLLHKPIGYQDQYIAAYGNFREIIFGPGKIVNVHHLAVKKETLRKLQENLFLFYTGIARNSGDILKEQQSNIEINLGNLRKMKEMVNHIHEALINHDPDRVGTILADYWSLKKELASAITNSEIDLIYRKALELGATGGKLVGAGGGGFLLLYIPREYHDSMRNNLGLQELSFHFENYGSKIIFDIHRS